jgi:RND family efflux transporter MFP subunit
MEPHEPSAVPPDLGPRRRRRPWLLLAAVVALLAAAQGIWSRHSAQAALERQTQVSSVPTVAVITPKREQPVQDLVLSGDIRAYSDAPIFARTSGYLRHWYVDIGGRVKKGQLLADIDSPEIEQQLRQARADEQIAQANYLLSKTTAERWASMLKSNSVSRQEADEKSGDRLAKQAALNAARANVARLIELTSFQKVYAPFDGVVTVRNTDVGQLIDAGSAGTAKELFHVQDARRLRVYVNVPQAYAQQIHAGLTAELTLNEQQGHHFSGVVVRTAGAVDPVARTMRTEIDVDNPSGDLLGGEYAQVSLRLTNPTPGLTLPGNALLFRPGGVRVATVDAHDRIKLLPITLGTDYGTRVAIASGLTGDERVIINPADAAVDGSPVRIEVPAAAQPRGKAS